MIWWYSVRSWSWVISDARFDLYQDVMSLIELISMNFDLSKITVLQGDAGAGSEEVHLKQKLVNSFINIGTAFSFCMKNCRLFFLNVN